MTNHNRPAAAAPAKPKAYVHPGWVLAGWALAPRRQHETTILDKNQIRGETAIFSQLPEELRGHILSFVPCVGRKIHLMLAWGNRPAPGSGSWIVEELHNTWLNLDFQIFPDDTFKDIHDRIRAVAPKAYGPYNNIKSLDVKFKTGLRADDGTPVTYAQLPTHAGVPLDQDFAFKNHALIDDAKMAEIVKKENSVYKTVGIYVGQYDHTVQILLIDV